MQLERILSTSLPGLLASRQESHVGKVGLGATVGLASEDIVGMTWDGSQGTGHPRQQEWARPVCEHGGCSREGRGEGKRVRVEPPGARRRGDLTKEMEREGMCTAGWGEEVERSRGGTARTVDTKDAGLQDALRVRRRMGRASAKTGTVPSAETASLPHTRHDCS